MIQPLIDKTRALMARRAGREAVLVAITQVVLLAITAGAVRVLTSLYPADVYGEANLYLSAVAVMATLSLSPVMESFVRLYPEYARTKQERLLLTISSRYAWKAILWVGAIALPVALVLTATVSWWALPTTLAAYAYYVANARTNLYQSLLSAARQHRWLSAMRVGRAALPPVLVAAASLIAIQTFGFVAAMAIASALFIAVGHWVCLRVTSAPTNENDNELTKRARAHLVSYGGPFVILAITNWVVALSDRYTISWLLGTHEVGIYAAIYGLTSQPFIALGGGITQWLRPILFQLAPKPDTAPERRKLLRAKSRKVLLAWLAVTLVCCLLGTAFIWFFRDLWQAVFLDPSYHATGYLILYLALGYSLHACSYPLTYSLLRRDLAKSQIGPNIAGGIAALSLPFVLIPALGLDGAGLATLAALGSRFVLLAVQVVRMPAEV